MKIPLIAFNGMHVTHIDSDSAGECGAVRYQGRMFVFRGGSRPDHCCFIETEVYWLEKQEEKPACTPSTTT